MGRGEQVQEQFPILPFSLVISNSALLRRETGLFPVLIHILEKSSKKYLRCELILEKLKLSVVVANSTIPTSGRPKDDVAVQGAPQTRISLAQETKVHGNHVRGRDLCNKMDQPFSPGFVFF